MRYRCDQCEVLGYFRFLLHLYRAIAETIKDNLMLEEIDEMLVIANVCDLKDHLRGLWKDPNMLHFPNWFNNALHDIADKILGLDLEVKFDVSKEVSRLNR